MDRDTSLLGRVWRWLFDDAGAERRRFARAFHVDAGGDDVMSRGVEEDLSPGEVLTELGLTPGEYVEYLLAVADGRLPERRLVEVTGWSSDTVAELLASLEEQRRIVRLPDGQRTMVCFPDAAPEPTATA